MKGEIRVTVYTKKLHYELTLRRNITVLQGDSATGKTTLVQIIADVQNDVSGPGTEVVCEKPCIVLTGTLSNALLILNHTKSSVVFVDEQERFLYQQEFAEAVLQSDCYFVFITRDRLSMLPYSVSEIYSLKNSGYYQNTRQVYNTMHQIYPELGPPHSVKPDLILTEDSNSGYQMYSAITEERNIACESAFGKGKIAGKILGQDSQKQVAAVVDGAAFGPEIKETLDIITKRGNGCLWAPESFEYLLLESGIVKDKDLQKMLQAPGDYIESGEYPSWERFFTSYLERITQGTIYQYSKKSLNRNYMTKGNIEKFLRQVPEEIILDDQEEQEKKK